MINVSTAWQRALFNDNRDFLEKVKITLFDGTILNLTNENIWGGVKIDDATSNDGDFEVGAAIVNKLSFNINNIYGYFDAYDFNNAYVEVSIGLVTDTSTEYIKKGEFTVNSATYNGSLINIECYDNMSRFDRPYSESTLIYPTTLDLIVRDACTKCGVTLATLNFPHKNYVISEKPSEQSTTFREVIAWSAQIAGCFARCNVDGDLELKWYDQASIGDGTDTLDGGIFDDGTPTYSTGDTADGGHFNPWNTGYVADGGVFTDRRSVHYISSLYSKNISVDDVIITGVRIIVKTDNTSVMHEELVGTTGYVVEISNNPMITTTNVHEIAVWLGNQLIGFKFRKAQITHGSNPAIEAGDVAFILDGKGNSYPIVISHTVFAVGSSQSTISSAQTPARNSSTRYNAQTKNYVEMRKAVQAEKTAREAIEDELSSAIQNAAGLYTTVVTDQETGKSTYYLHNKNNLNESAVRLMFSDAGITVTADGGANWYGLTVSGTMLVNLLATTGLHADWINAGQLVVSKNGQETFFVDVDTGTVRIVADSFSLRSGRTIDGAYTNGDNKATAAQNAAIQASNNYTDGKITTVNQAIDNIQQQIDGEVDFYYYDYVPTMNNIPASDWTGSTAEETEQIRKSHEGDTFLHISTGQTYRFLKLSGQWQWSLIQDSGVSQAMHTAQEALTTARSKVRAFTQEPVPPYEVGDMWLQGSSGDLLVCQTSKTATGDTYSRSDWVIATKYTDDTAFTTWKNGEFATTLATLQTGIRDAKIETFYQSNDPSTAWTTPELKLIHEGDIWCNSSTQKSYRWSGSAWQTLKTDPPQEVLDKVDGKANIFVGNSTPSNPNTGDLWFKSANDPILTYVNGVWREYNKYTDNTYITNWLTSTYAVDKQGLQNQIDGKIETFYQTANPATSWTTEEKSKHIGDLWYNSSTDTQKYYRWNGTAWSEMTASPPDAVFDKIDGKAQVFVGINRPTPPYRTGDLWFNSTEDNTGEIYTCIYTRDSGTGAESDWAIRNKYTDNSELTIFQGVVDGYVSNLQGQIDNQVMQWFINGVPTTSNYPASQWTTEEERGKHINDLCYDKDTGKVYQYVGRVGGCKIKFASECATEGISYDYVQIFYQYNDSFYSLPKIGGNGSSNTIANAEVFVPTDVFWLRWKTDSSQENYYGFRIESVTGAVGTHEGTLISNIPSTATSEDVIGVPESNHNGYGNNIDIMYRCFPTVTIPAGTYEWVEIQDEDIRNALTAASNAQTTADGKMRVFMATPTPPYDPGDLWTQGASGGILRCKTGHGKTAGQQYNEDDWEVATNYVDDNTLASYVSTITGEIEGLSAQIDSKIDQYFINGVPTTSNYPASEWTTSEDKYRHIDDLCYDKTTGKVYRYLYKKSNLKLTFSSDSETEGINYDYVRICYEQDGKIYQTPKLGGRGNSNTIANAEVIIPTSTYQVYWKTDGSQDGYYGFRIASAEIVLEETTEAAEVSSLPSYTTSETLTVGDLPESEHNGYGNSVQKMFFCDSGETIPTTTTFMWAEIQDADIQRALEDASTAKDTADGKRRVFVSSPVPPYDTGDLWAQGTNGDLLKCVTPRTEGQTFDLLTDWARATKYTDDSYATDWINGTYESDKGSLQNQIDGKIETFSQSTDPSTSWTSDQKAKHTGDLWYNPTSNDQKYRRWSGTEWVEITATPPASVQSLINSKANIFTGSTRPSPPYKLGDLWFNGTSNGTGEIYTCVINRTSGSGYASDWQIRNKYAAYAEELISDFDLMLNQNEVLSRLVAGGDQIYLQDGNLYILASAILGDILKMGGRNNANGEIEVYNSSGTRIGLWNMNGLFIGNISGTSKDPTGANTKIATNGDISTKSLTAEDYIYVDGDHHSAFNIKINGTTYSDYVSISDEGFIGYVNISNSIKCGTLIATRRSMKQGGNIHSLIAYDANYTYVPTADATYVDYDGFYIQRNSGSVVSRFTQGEFVVSNGVNTLFTIFDSTKAGNLGMSDNYLNWFRFFVNNVYMNGNLSVTGTKKRIASTKDYSNRSLYCYEMPSPMFGDVGEGVIGTDGLCYVNIDPIFAETISTNQYQVFLQAYGDGKCFVKERKSSYFVVQGEPNLPFGWEIKAKQAGFTQMRLDIDGITDVNESGSTDYVTEAINHINTIRSERNVEE